jgi:hypothetical protein
MISVVEGEDDNEQLSLLISSRAACHLLGKQFERKLSMNYLDSYNLFVFRWITRL